MSDQLTISGRNYTVRREFTPIHLGGIIRRLRASDEHGSMRSVLLFQSSAAEERNIKAAADAVAALDDYEVFPHFETIGKLDFDGAPRLAWVEKWVSGERLRELIEERWRRLTVTDLQQLVIDLSEALTALRAEGVVHGAISAETVIWAQPPAGAKNRRNRFRVVNMSRSRAASEQGEQSLDERSALRLIADTLNALLRRPDIPSESRSYLDRVKKFIVAAWNDLNSGAHLRLESLEALGADEHTLSSQRTQRGLTDPFNFLSTEHFSSDALLYEVFADSCPWVEDVSRPDPTLIQGPRGCGKSMVLRWLSVKTQLAGPAPVEALDALEIAGFYIPFASEIQSRLARFSRSQEAQAKRVPIIHYLNMIILREVASTLARMAKMDEPSWGLTRTAASDIWSFLSTELNSERPLAAGVDLWEQIRDLAYEQLNVAHDALEGRQDPSRFTVGSFAQDLARTLTERIPFFARHRIAFCLDDYSTHRIPPSVQEIFNEVVFSVRSGNHVFKISAENRGFHAFTTAGARIDIQREMTHVDFGRKYIEFSAENPAGARQFARDLLANRLRSAGWAGTPESLIGEVSQSGVEFARRSRENISKRPPLYFGLRTVSELCSGDVSNLLLVYKYILSAGQTTPTSSELISETIQNEAIRNASRYLVEVIRANVPYGSRMLGLVEEFASLSQYAMLSGSTIKNHGGEEPRMQTRIEIDGLSLHREDLTGPATEERFLLELLRRSVFIELAPGTARHGIGEGTYQTATRLMLRKIYLPAHGLSLSKNVAWVWSPSQFSMFLNDTKRFCARQRTKLKEVPRPNSEVIPGLEF